MIPVKPRNVVFSLKRNEQDHPPLFLDTKVVKDVESHTHLGLTLKSNMWWRNHMVNWDVQENLWTIKYILKCVKYKVDRSTLTCFYKSLIRTLTEFGDVICNNCHNRDSALLDNVQYEAATVITGAIKGTSSARLHDELAWEPLSIRRERHKLSQF